MQTAKRSLSVSVLALLVACAGRTPLPAPASLQVDVQRDIVLVPPDVCPRFGGWICMTEEATRLQEMQRTEEDRQWRLMLAESQGSQYLAETQRDQAVRAVEESSFWSKWGFPLGLLGGFVVTAAGAVLIWEVSHGR